MEDSIKLIMTEFEGTRWCSEHELKRVYKTLADMINNLKTENARYRDALEFIANGGVASSSIKHRYIDEAYQEIAIEALKGKE